MNNYDELSKLQIEKMKLDKFFSMYLDKYGSKLDSENTNTPHWKLYHSKYEEYMNLDRKIKSLQYFMSKR